MRDDVRSNAEILFLAIEYKSHELIADLIKENPLLLTAKNKEGLTPAQFAAKPGRWETLITLSKNAPEYVPREAHFSGALLNALNGQMWEAALALLQHPIAEYGWHFPDTQNGLLHTAIRQDAPANVVLSLLERNVNSKKKNEEGKTALC